VSKDEPDDVPDLEDHLLDGLRVEPGSTVDLPALPTKGSLGDVIDELSKAERKSAAEGLLDGLKAELAEAQELLYADDRHSILVVMQAMDAGGKDGTIRHVMSGVNPAGVDVVSYKRPSAEELDHSFLWRHQKDAPARGRIGIFNRSHYEEVLVARVHPEVVANQRIPEGDPTHESFWAARYRDINAWEQHLTSNGTRVVKLFLHLSKEEQRERFLSRLEVPEKLWKFEPADLAERAHWDAYQEAFAEMLEATSTEAAPWYVIPADRKYAMRVLVAAILVRTITGLDLQYPEVSAEDQAAYAEMQAQLEAEGSDDADADA
jgi:PPK2 family polyphosphate:nucleotide phosphotransferase